MTSGNASTVGDTLELCRRKLLWGRPLQFRIQFNVVLPVSTVLLFARPCICNIPLVFNIRRQTEIHLTYGVMMTWLSTVVDNANLRCPCGMDGRRSVRGVVQFTPYDFRVAFVISVLSRAVKAHRNCPDRVGKLSITSSNWNRQITWHYSNWEYLFIKPKQTLAFQRDCRNW
jgi:hypothetical protein